MSDLSELSAASCYSVCDVIFPYLVWVDMQFIAMVHFSHPRLGIDLEAVLWHVLSVQPETNKQNLMLQQQKAKIILSLYKLSEHFFNASQKGTDRQLPC